MCCSTYPPLRWAADADAWPLEGLHLCSSLFGNDATAQNTRPSASTRAAGAWTTQIRQFEPSLHTVLGFNFLEKPD